MNYNFKQSAPSVLLFLGYILYFILLFKSTFSFSIIWMILLIYLWVISSLFFNKYSLNSFLCVFSLSVASPPVFWAGGGGGTQGASECPSSGPRMWAVRVYTGSTGVSQLKSHGRGQDPPASVRRTTNGGREAAKLSQTPEVRG